MDIEAQGNRFNYDVSPNEQTFEAGTIDIDPSPAELEAKFVEFNPQQVDMEQFLEPEFEGSDEIELDPVVARKDELEVDMNQDFSW